MPEDNIHRMDKKYFENQKKGFFSSIGELFVLYTKLNNTSLQHNMLLNDQKKQTEELKGKLERLEALVVNDKMSG